MIKPTILPGFMELNPKDQMIFNQLRDIIREVYESFGFLPIDTPVIEKSEVLLAKGGGETEKQIYRFEKGDTDMSLRFDLTVPLARYTAEHFHELNFPFKRYQIGKVYRGERNQKGRFREFYQCDVDTIGNENLSVANDAEFPAIIYEIFKRFDFGDFTIRVNNRKLLTGFYDFLGIKDTQEVIRIIDKIDKVGEDKTKEALLEIIDEKSVGKIFEFLSLKGDNAEILQSLKNFKIDNEVFQKGIEEMEEFLDIYPSNGVPEGVVKLDMTLARGLDYYTGTIYETFLNDFPSLGSVCGGGRYENLAGHYTDKKLPGVGVSIGLTRLFYQLNEAGLLNKKTSHPSEILIIPMEGFIKEGNSLAESLRKENISADIYYETGKMGKKFSFADKSQIPYATVIGEEEAKNNKYTLKSMLTGEQKSLDKSELIEFLRREK